MSDKELPLYESSISDLFFSPENKVYEVPIYQRNYAWETDEIKALVQDVYDAFNVHKNAYYIGTLVTFHKGKHVYEIIDGQQRLTTIFLMLKALGESPRNELTYRSRKKSSDTINGLDKPGYGGASNIDEGIANGFESAKNAIGDIVPESERHDYGEYFKEHVHIVFYKVPKDIDLNHYFEVMNSRGEQLEQHEVVKAMLLGKLEEAQDRSKFNQIWELCSEMDGYIQQSVGQKISSDAAEKVFGLSRNRFQAKTFDELPGVESDSAGLKSIKNLLDEAALAGREPGANGKPGVRFQPIIDFPNFLLIVLKLTRMGEAGFDPDAFILDDKEIIRQFDEALAANSKLGRVDSEFAKRFGYNLLLSKFFLDNYVVHHVLDEEKPGDNPWKLQCWEWHRNDSGDKGYPSNLFGDDREDDQARCLQLLSMFEVSFTARQRKNYLLYCMLYLHANKDNPRDGYPQFLSDLARTYLNNVYLGSDAGLNDKNTPKPGSFDAAVLEKAGMSPVVVYGMRNLHEAVRDAAGPAREVAEDRFGNGSVASKGIPLFVFNYLDYMLWESYFDNVRGCKKGEGKRRVFFNRLGCSDFGLDVFDDFYFSRTRRSLEHFYSQAHQERNKAKGGPTKAQINCLGNYAMIGHDMNSYGSDWSPVVKLDHYRDASGKINRISVASLKFMVMMQICEDNKKRRDSGGEWIYEDIEQHQHAMIDVLLAKRE